MVGTATVSDGDEILLMTTEGIVIRTVIESIPILSKTTSGVKLMNIDKDSDAKIASFTIIPASASDEEEENSDLSEDEGYQEDSEKTEDAAEDSEE